MIITSPNYKDICTKPTSRLFSSRLLCWDTQPDKTLPRILAISYDREPSTSQGPERMLTSSLTMIYKFIVIG